MEDFGEYTPLDSLSADGTPGTAMHNLYPRHYHCAAQRLRAARGAAARPLQPLRLDRRGAMRADRLGRRPDHRLGLRRARARRSRNGLTMGLSGISTWGSDIGGFFALGANQLDPGAAPALGPVRRRLRGDAHPGERDRAAGQGARRRSGTPARSTTGAAMRSSARASTPTSPPPRPRTGAAGCRSCAISRSSIPATAAPPRQDDEFLFGPDLLAAPVVEPGATQRRLYMPRGQWIDLWRSATYREGSGGLRLRGARMAGGRRETTIPAPLDELPLLVRAGTILPLLPPDVDTLASYGGGNEDVVGLRERAGRIDLLAFPRGRSTARFYDDGRIASIERGDRWTLRVRGSRSRSYDLQASLGALKRPLRPCRVLLDGRRLPASHWRYRAGERVLDASFDGARAKLTVVGRTHDRCG